MKKEVLYIYTSKENKEYVERMSRKYNVRISGIISRLIEGHRLEEPVKFTLVPPKFVERAEAWKRKNE